MEKKRASVKMKRYDLHMHTHYSPCSSNSPERVLKKAKKAGLDGIAITDHNTIKGAIEVKHLNKDKDFEVIIGEEISTDCGEILALYIDKRVRPGKLMNVIKDIKKQKGRIIIAHPYRFTPWLKFRCPLPSLVGKVDAIETFNSRNILFGNTRAKKYSKGLDFAFVGSSDAHILLDIGKGYTTFQGNLKDAIKKRQTTPKGTCMFGIISAGIAFLNKRVLDPLKVKKRWT